MTTLSGWQNQDSTRKPTLVPPVQAAVALLQESFPLFGSFYDLLLHLPVSATHLSFRIGCWSSLTVECVSVLAPHVAWELVQGVTISLGRTVSVPDSHGYVATVPCY